MVLHNIQIRGKSALLKRKMEETSKGEGMKKQMRPAMEGFQDFLKTFIRVIMRRTENRVSVDNDLAATITETGKTISEVTDRIQTMKERAVNQRDSVTQTNAAMGQIIVNLKLLRDVLAKRNESAAKLSADSAQMLANIRSVMDALAPNAAKVMTLTETAVYEGEADKSFAPEKNSRIHQRDHRVHEERIGQIWSH
jgi:methyl-accepting chemotaxis protein